ncbi:MAG: hypothetical protein KA214_03645 [Neisseriaceae bacterium]|nr:hypothetical protein [Neisseriaceae bacterium]
MKTLNRVLALVVCMGLSVQASAKVWPWGTAATPACYGESNWATQLTLSSMVANQYIVDSAGVDFAKLKTTLLESTKVGKYQFAQEEDVYRQIQKVSMTTRDGRTFEVLTISEATFTECSMGSPRIILVAPEFKVLERGASILE